MSHVSNDNDNVSEEEPQEAQAPNTWHAPGQSLALLASIATIMPSESREKGAHDGHPGNTRGPVQALNLLRRLRLLAVPIIVGLALAACNSRPSAPDADPPTNSSEAPAGAGEVPAPDPVDAPDPGAPPPNDAPACNMIQPALVAALIGGAVTAWEPTTTFPLGNNSTQYTCNPKGQAPAGGYLEIICGPQAETNWSLESDDVQAVSGLTDAYSHGDGMYSRALTKDASGDTCTIKMVLGASVRDEVLEGALAEAQASVQQQYL